MESTQSPMTVTFVLLVVAGGISFLLWALSVDALLRRIHAEHRDLWLSFGSPPGWLWAPPGVSWLRGAAARQRFVTDTWLYRPAWVKIDPVLRGLWRRMAILSMIAFSIPILLIISSIVT